MFKKGEIKKELALSIIGGVVWTLAAWYVRQVLGDTNQASKRGF